MRSSRAIIPFLILLAFFAGGMVFAQKGDVKGSGSGAGGGEKENPRPNTTKEDSALIQAIKNVDPQTMYVYPSLVKANLYFRDEVKFDISKIPFRDEIEHTNGFSQILGQIGKPYRRFFNGAPSEFYDSEYHRNLINGAENVYIVNPETQVKYYDTRTPFVNVDFGQGKNELASLEITASQNISPFVNVTLDYHRRQSEGPYANFFTDHYNVYVSANAHSRDERYIAFANVGFNELLDEINGGVGQLYGYDSLFDKRSQPVSLTEAVLRRKYRDMYFNQFYRLSNDTMVTPHRFALFNSVLRDEQLYQYTDTSISTSLANFTYPIYPTLDTLNFFERAIARRWKFTEGVSYRFSSTSFVMNHRVQITNERINFLQEDQSTVLNRFTPEAQGELELRPEPFSFGVDYNLRTFTSNLYRAGYYASADVYLNLGKYKTNYKEVIPGYKLGGADSLSLIVEKRPLSLFATALLHSKNPEFLQTYYTPYQTNLLPTDPTLGNQNFLHLKGGIAAFGKDRKGQFRVVPGNLATVSAFISRTNQPIFYDSTMALTQMAPSEFVEWRGIEARFRLHMRKFSIENSTVLQQASTNLAPELDADFVESQPWLYGKAGFYYENQDLKIASIIRAGIECYYNVGFKGWLFEPASQQYYAQNTFQMPGYPRLDVIFSTQIKKAYLYVRVVNVNEGWPEKGYFTTPFYPMLDRTVMFGVTWSFYD